VSSCLTTHSVRLSYKSREEKDNSRILVSLALLWASLSVQASSSYAASPDDAHPSGESSSAQSADPVLQWNKNLLAIISTAGAQPATVHPTHSFAIMHAAIYDAVNAIDGKHAHLRGALNLGWTLDELREALLQISGYAGFPAAHEALRVLSEAVTQR
jgi:hypothetical protein